MAASSSSDAAVVVPVRAQLKVACLRRRDIHDEKRGAIMRDCELCERDRDYAMCLFEDDWQVKVDALALRG